MRLLETLLEKQRLKRGIGFGAVTSLILTFIAARLSAAYGFSLSPSLIGVALLSGLVIRWQGRGVEPPFGFASVGLAAVSGFIGYIVHFMARMRTSEVDAAIAELASAFSLQDAGLVFVALLAAYFAAFRRLNVADLGSS